MAKKEKTVNPRLEKIRQDIVVLEAKETAIETAESMVSYADTPEELQVLTLELLDAMGVTVKKEKNGSFSIAFPSKLKKAAEAGK